MQTQEKVRFAAMMTQSADLKRRIATELADAVIGVVDACEASLRAGGKLMFCGNGGSAADSPAFGNGNADPAAAEIRTTVDRRSGADAGSGDADRLRQRLWL